MYQIAAGYEDCNDADSLRTDPALRLALEKGNEAGAGQSRLSRLENEVLGTEAGLTSGVTFYISSRHHKHIPGLKTS